MKAVIKYSNGWQLLLPKEGFAPMLLLEWLANFRAGANVIHKVNEEKNGILSIRLNVSKIEMEDCATYINSNS